MILDLFKFAIIVALWLAFWLATPGDAEGAELVSISREARDVVTFVGLFVASLIALSIIAIVMKPRV